MKKMQQTITMILLIIIFLPMIVKGFPLMNVELPGFVNIERTRTSSRRVEISHDSEELESFNELNNNGNNEDFSTIRIFIPTNRDRFDSWGG